MKRSLLTLFLCLAGSLALAEIPFDTLRERVVDDLAAGAVWRMPENGKPEGPSADPLGDALREAPTLLAKLTPEGAWPDINYADRHRTLWPAQRHLTRLLTIATVYGAPASPKFRDAKLRDALLRGLGHWVKTHPICDNWWFNQIYAPQRLGEILLLVQHGGGNPPDEIFKPLVERWKAEGNDPSKKSSYTTGSNLMNIAAHWAYRGILTRDEATLRIGAEGLFRPLCVTTGEGLQPDGSYHQHGPQLYIGNYGYDWLFLQAAWLSRLRGTDLMPPPERAALATRFALEATLPATRGQWYLFNAVGRQQASEPTRAQATKLLSIIRWLKTLSPEALPQLKAAEARLRGDRKAPKPEAASRVFWRSDYAIATRPAVTYELRGVSKRTQRSEHTNNENLLGYHLVEGATGITMSGTEYADIAPLWDWFKVPGTTTLVGPNDKAISRKEGRGEATMVGGATDGEALAFIFTRETKGNTAKKATFVFGDTMLCLGCDLSSDNPNQHLVTTLNQCWANKAPMPKGGKSVTYGGLRYTLLEDGATLLTSKEHRKNNWKRVSSARKDPAEGDIATFWIDHGVAPKSATYAYAIQPAAAAKPTIRILSNTPDVQAAASGETLAVIFHKPGTFQGLTADKPCLMLQTPKGLFRAYPGEETKKLR